MSFTRFSFLISSSNPRKLANFYSLIMDSNVCKGLTENDFSIEDDKFCQMSFYRPSKKKQFTQFAPPSLSICFQKKPSKEPLLTIDAWIKEVVSFGAKLFEGPNLDSFGAEAWLLDVEDNKFLIFVPTADSQ